MHRPGRRRQGRYLRPRALYPRDLEKLLPDRADGLAWMGHAADGLRRPIGPGGRQAAELARQADSGLGVALLSALCAQKAI